MNREDIITQLFEAMNNTKRSMHSRMHTFANGLPISRTQIELLFTLKHLESTTSAKLAKHMHLTPGAISQLVESLVQLKLVTRTNDPSDRRTQFLSISEDGLVQMHEIEKSRHELLKHVMASLTTEELQLLLHVQQKMVEELNTNDKEQN